MVVEFTRRLDLPALLEKKSHFLFGPRGTGKSFLVRSQLSHRATVIDLLRSDVALRLLADPSELDAMIPMRSGGPPWVVIDEVQKVPALLDEVHRLIEARRIRFLLTGSSARKLRRGQANMLAGRAWTAALLPLTWAEMPKFDLADHLRWGGLPAVRTSDHPAEELHAYARTYLYDEIAGEGLVRRLPPFSRFLTVAALANGQMLNYAKIASDAAVPAATVREYFTILEDTLLGFELPAWRASRTRKAIGTAKFYLFDTGVTHALAGTRHVDRNSDLWGRSFEQWIGTELRAYLAYARRTEELAYWRSTHGHEVDFLVGDHTAIEVKATRRVKPDDLRGLRALADERPRRRAFLVSDDPIIATRENVSCLPWKAFVEALWADELLPRAA